MVQGFGFGVVGFGFVGPVCGLRVEALGLRVLCVQLRFEVQGLVFTILVEVIGLRVKCLMFGVEDSGRGWGSELCFEGSGFGF